MFLVGEFGSAGMVSFSTLGQPTDVVNKNSILKIGYTDSVVCGPSALRLIRPHVVVNPLQELAPHDNVGASDLSSLVVSKSPSLSSMSSLSTSTGSSEEFKLEVEVEIPSYLLFGSGSQYPICLILQACGCAELTDIFLAEVCIPLSFYMLI